MQRLILFLGLLLGAVALLIGVVGLLAPVSISPEEASVRCGSAIAPDLSEARAADDRSAANVPILDEVVADTNYTRLCQMELADRRIWTITVGVAGALAIGGTLGYGVLSRRASASH